MPYLCFPASQNQKASGADPIISDVVMRNNFFPGTQSLHFEDLIWVDHILFHLNWAWLENMQLTHGKPQTLRFRPGLFGPQSRSKGLGVHDQTAAQVATLTEVSLGVWADLSVMTKA